MRCSNVGRTLAVCFVPIGVTLMFAAQSARAQFVCVDNAASLQGASAAGSASNFACGSSANASGINSFNTATGGVANASGDASANTAAGRSSNASGAGSQNFAGGVNANASGDGSFNTATGSNANASGSGGRNSAYGVLANASGTNSYNTAAGYNADASGAGSVNTAIGQGAVASGAGTHNTAVGAGAVATGADSAAFGYGATATFSNSTAIGPGAVATAANQMTFGNAGVTAYRFQQLPSIAGAGTDKLVSVDASGNLRAIAAPSGIAIVNDLTTGGTAAALSAQQGVVLNGLAATAQTTANTAITVATNATTLANTAITNATAAQTTANTALANAATAQNTASSATVLANNAQTTANSALTNAAGAQTTANTARVEAAAAQTTANGALQRSGGAMSGAIDMGGNAIANLATPVAAGDAANKGYVDSQLAAVSGGLATLNSKLSDVSNRADRATQGVAMAFAMAGTPTLMPSETFAISGNWGGYEGKSGLAFGAAYKLDASVQLNGGFAYGVNENTVGGRVGVRMGW